MSTKPKIKPFKLGAGGLSKKNRQFLERATAVATATITSAQSEDISLHEIALAGAIIIAYWASKESETLVEAKRKVERTAEMIKDLVEDNFGSFRYPDADD